MTTDSQQEQRIHHGQTVLVRELEGGEGDWVKLVNLRRQFIADQPALAAQADHLTNAGPIAPGSSTEVSFVKCRRTRMQPSSGSHMII